MLQKLLTGLFGSRNQRLVKQYGAVVKKINALEPAMQALSDAELTAKTQGFKDKVAAGASLDSVLIEAFAVVREASVRVMGMRHFDVQLIGAMVLHNGNIAEMRTGEGKTLTATAAVYLNALSGQGVHVVTVNDYLARRDAEWMGKLYNFLGLSVGVNVPGLERAEKQAAYAADITYGTNNEFGFDYLRDNLIYDAADRVQKPLRFAIVDEVDSILIDEARTPLIISGQADDQTELYQKINAVPPLLTKMLKEPVMNEPEPEGDYWLDEKGHQVHLSESGHEKAEQILSRLGLLPEGASLYSPQHIALMHHVNVALKAHTLFHRDQHYVVQDGEVVIVDEFTGRLMSGRRWSDGIHQAVEAKEKVAIQQESQTLASITFQNYFRMYKKLGGMTGTADTEAYEFQSIYGLETVVIPTHRNMIRKDLNDQVFRSEAEKQMAILKAAQDCYERGQPVLIGTASVEMSEAVAQFLSQHQLPHNVLNAKQHAREAEIIAQAGKPKAITVATNMAGRGTDIVLGGNVEKQMQFIEADAALSEADKAQKIAELKDGWAALHDQVLSAGGLKIIGTERHESRRIDNQLRGRSGRQGDAGVSRFYLSMDDQLLRIFSGDKLKAVMNRLKLPEGEPIEAGMVSRSIEGAQRKVEARNFEIRKQLLEYDDVANDQRRVLYQQRNDIVDTDDMRGLVDSLRRGVFTDIFRQYVPEESIAEQWDLSALTQTLGADWAITFDAQALLDADDSLDDIDLLDKLLSAADAAYQAKLEQVDVKAFHDFERTLMLQVMDTRWREHLAALDYLRQGIHLRGYAQKNPKQEYKREAFEMFGSFLDAVKTEVIRVIMNVKIQSAEEAAAAEAALAQRAQLDNLQFQHDDASTTNNDAESGEASSAASKPAARPSVNVVPKVGRNDPCPCGSGKKYKQCHGALA